MGKKKVLSEVSGSLLALENVLRSRGYAIKQIAADGNCLFRALCHQLGQAAGYGDDDDHIRLRGEVCDYMKKNEEDFSPFMEDGVKIDNYLERMRRNGVWGGNHELLAVSRLLAMDIQLHRPPWDNDIGTGTLGTVQVISGCDKPKGNLRLVYDGHEHYNSIDVSSIREGGSGSKSEVTDVKPAPPVELEGGWAISKKESRRIAKERKKGKFPNSFNGYDEVDGIIDGFLKQSI
jgi:hypothetical protein